MCCAVANEVPISFLPTFFWLIHRRSFKKPFFSCPMKISFCFVLFCFSEFFSSKCQWMFRWSTMLNDLQISGILGMLIQSLFLSSNHTIHHLFLFWWIFLSWFEKTICMRHFSQLYETFSSVHIFFRQLSVCFFKQRIFLEYFCYCSCYNSNVGLLFSPGEDCSRFVSNNPLPYIRLEGIFLVSPPTYVLWCLTQHEEFDAKHFAGVNVKSHSASHHDMLDQDEIRGVEGGTQTNQLFSYPNYLICEPAEDAEVKH